MIKDGAMDPILSLYMLYDPAVLADPHPFYHRLREAAPVLRDPVLGHWMVTGYAETVRGLLEQRLSARRIPELTALPAAYRATMGPLVDLAVAQMLFQDEPDHGRIRSVVAKAFTPRRAAQMSARISAVVDELVAPLSDGAELDIVTDLAYPLPAIVIAELLGAPAEDRHLFKGWCDDFIKFVATTGLSDAELIQAATSATAMMDYFRDLVVARRSAPRDDLLSDLVRAQDDGRVTSEREFLANCIILLTAGHETSTHMLGNALLALFRHPDQRDILAREPQRAPAALNELLRYDGPVQFIAREARDDVALGDARICRGERVLLMLAAANRDPRTFTDPDTLDIARQDARPLAFGHGAHICLGAPLARLEGEIALATLARRFPSLTPTTDILTWQSTVTFRGLAALPVRA